MFCQRLTSELLRAQIRHQEFTTNYKNTCKLLAKYKAEFN